MSWNARRASIVLLPLILTASAFWLEPGRAQDKAVKTAVPALPAPAAPPARANANMNPDGFLNNGIHLVKDEKRRSDQIQAALDYINDEKWDVAVQRLQKLLEIDEDVFVRLKRKNAEGDDVFIWVSAKQEADRLIGSLPAAGKDFYKATFGAKAAELLKKAKKNGDPGLLNDIMKKYAHTDAGAEAIKLLGDYKFDRGEFMPALLCYSKLINRLGEDKAPIAMLAKAAWAAHLAPPSSSDKNTVTAAIVFSEKELWRMLRGRTREVQFGEQTMAIEDLQEHVAKLDRHRLEQNATDSLLYRATISRSNQLTGGPAFLAREWGVSLLYENGGENISSARTARDFIKKAKHTLKTQNQPIIPAFSPITLSVLDNKGEKKPLLIYKNFFGVTATDLRDGKLAWASPSTWSLQRMLSAGGSKQNTVANWLRYYETQHPQILFENSTVGTLSTDGQFVYVVEDLAVPPDPQPNLENGMVFRGGMMQNPTSLDKDLEDAVSHNRLYALSLTRSGALTWALGDDEKDPLKDHYFLGPPLPLAGKLYVLADKQQEIRLICLDPTVLAKDSRNVQGAIVSTQTLGMTQEKLQNDALRRTWAAHLAYGEGILVCPTNAGAVFGVNLLENSLVWAYPYRDKNDANEQSQQPQWNGGRIRQWPPPGFIIGPDGQLRRIENRQNQWKVSAPVISDGKVVFTAPDARSIHCINLRDGSPLWKRPKLEEDLYLGNVYNGKVLIIGKKSVRALSLATGDAAPEWEGPLATGTPSGQGIGSDNIYYLPLKDAGKGRDDPQIIGIDIDRGKIVSGRKSQSGASGKSDGEVPGNLIFAEGKVISVSPFMKGENEDPDKKCEGEVVAYPQVKVKIGEMDDKIAKNPNDANALTERGELRLDKGDLAGAIDDLSTALQNNPSKEIGEKARAKLYDTLTVYIADHFNEAERYLDEYEKLCHIDLDAAPQAERSKLEAEQRRRRSTFLWLVGKGREEQGRLVEAFEKYQQFAKEAGKQSELVPAVDDRQVKAAPDVWSRGRIIAMMNNAKPENRRPLENLIADKWKKLRETNDLDELRSFVRMFGSASDAGKEARLELVERLMERQDSAEEHPLLEAELELNQFRTGIGIAPELAARATEALARLYTRKSLLEDAAYCYRKLRKEYAKTVIRDGKTGEQIYDDDAATDKRLLPYLDDPLPLGSVKGFRYRNDNGDFPPPYRNNNLFQFEQSGEKLPFFRHHIFGLTLDNHRFVVLDRNLEDENHQPRPWWDAKLSDTAFNTLVRTVLGHQQQDQMMNVRMRGGMGAAVGMPVNPNNNPNVRFPYSTVGHLIVLPVGHRVFGLDPVYKHILWEKNLSEGSGVVSTEKSGRGPAVNIQQHPLVVDPRDGSVLVTYTDNWAQRLGQVSPFQGRTICVQSVNKLSALDPITGRTLWSRMDVNSRNYLFSDEDYVFVVELDNQNNPSSTRVFRAADGISVKANDFAAQFGKRHQVFGRYLLVAEAGPSNEVLVRLYDIITGQDVWKQKYPTRTIVAHSEDASLTGVVEPNGKVHVIDLRQRQEVMTGQIFEPAERLKDAKSFHLLADRNYFYFAAQTTPPNANAQGNNLPPSSVMTHLGMRTVPVSGYLRAFERKTGKHRWDSFVSPSQFLVLDQLEDSPLLILTARVSDLPNANAAGGMPGGPGMMIQQPGNLMVKVTSIHKNTGLVVCDEKLPSKTTNFYGVRIDPRANTVELLSEHLKITHYPKPDEKQRAKSSEESPRSEGTPSLAPEAKAAAKKVSRPVLDRVRIPEIAPPLPPR